MKIYCSGIGGIGLSAYAALQNANGHSVYGSDRTKTPLTDDLISQGIDVSLNQDGSHVPEDTDLFVYSEAIPETAPERVRARELGVTQRTYFQALGDLSKEYDVIAVAGTHGKSSTTAMAAQVLTELGLDPTIVVGTKLPFLSGRNWRKGNSNLFLLEACEYRGSFLSLYPDSILLLNADGDHFDAFDSVEHYQDVFVEFLKRLPEGGSVYTHMGDPDNVSVVERSGVSAVDCDHIALPELALPARHMQENAQLILGMAEARGFDSAKVRESLKNFVGCWRRMEIKGEFRDGITIIDDYAHHPREIRATLGAIRDVYKDNRLVVVFQPHTHDRSLKLYEDFLTAFTGADALFVMDVYDARPDTETGTVDIEQYVQDLQKESGVEALYSGNEQSTEELLRKEGTLETGDTVLFMGAGTITGIATRMSE